MPSRAPTETPRVLKEWRLAQTPYMSQEKAAQHLKVPHRSYVRWELGENHPQESNILKMAKKMGVDSNEFYAIGEEESPAETRERIQRIEEVVMEMRESLSALLAKELGEAAASQGVTQASRARSSRKNQGRTAQR